MNAIRFSTVLVARLAAMGPSRPTNDRTCRCWYTKYKCTSAEPPHPHFAGPHCCTPRQKQCGRSVRASTQFGADRILPPRTTSAQNRPGAAACLTIVRQAVHALRKANAPKLQYSTNEPFGGAVGVRAIVALTTASTDHRSAGATARMPARAPPALVRCSRQSHPPERADSRGTTLRQWPPCT